MCAILYQPSCGKTASEPHFMRFSASGGRKRARKTRISGHPACKGHAQPLCTSPTFVGDAIMKAGEFVRELRHLCNSQGKALLSGCAWADLSAVLRGATR